jgi:DNA-binding NarL/FixJ family response regulator
MSKSARATVFIVDDAPLLIPPLVDLIELAGRARVIGTSDSAREALFMILRLKPSAVLLDWHLREGSGLDVLVGLTSAGCSAVRIVLTNLVDPSARAVATAAGADFFYDKTLEFKQAIARINEIGANARVQPNPTRLL